MSVPLWQHVTLSKLKTGPIPGVFLKGMLDHIRTFESQVFAPEWVPAAVELLRAASKSGDKQAVADHRAQIESSKARQFA